MRVALDELYYRIDDLKYLNVSDDDIKNAIEAGINFEKHYAQHFTTKQIAALCKVCTYNKTVEDEKMLIKLGLVDKRIIPSKVVEELLANVSNGSLPPKNNKELLSLMSPNLYKIYLKNVIETDDIKIYTVFTQGNKHIFNEHTNRENEDLIKRIIKEQKQGSIFVGDIEAITKEVLAENVDKIALWLNSRTRDDIHIDKSFNRYVGKGYDLMFNEKKSKNVHAILSKDKRHPLGFKIATIYPDMEKKGQVTYTGNRISSFDLKNKYNASYVTTPGYRVFAEIKPQLKSIIDATAFYKESTGSLNVHFFQRNNVVKAIITKSGNVYLKKGKKNGEISERISMDDLCMMNLPAVKVLNRILDMIDKDKELGDKEFSSKIPRTKLNELNQAIR